MYTSLKTMFVSSIRSRYMVRKSLMNLRNS
ncbi:hypothetical protein F383_37651 [Gossypium arboreum]|uniref:Uncharacterized protein n=1 Tax=Gossypium arboreum TaxID=29729 RepID=A0A0B0M8H2_GOSAR|nr:hypothetical protein F383_37651 [Gossypium arboreum]